jgi:hypothetical protein
MKIRGEDNNKRGGGGKIREGGRVEWLDGKEFEDRSNLVIRKHSLIDITLA